MHVLTTDGKELLRRTLFHRYYREPLQY